MERIVVGAVVAPVPRESVSPGVLAFEVLSGQAIEPEDALAALDAMTGHGQRPDCFLSEWTTYRVMAPGAETLRIGSTVVPPLIPDHGIFDIRFENQLGIAHIQPLRAGRPLGPATTVEVIATKFATPLESIRFTDRVLTDLFARQAPLPFLAAAPTGRLVREARRPPNLLFAWHFFRRYGYEVIRAVQVIAHHPLQRLSDVREDVRIAEATTIDLDTMLSVLHRATRNDVSEPGIAHRLQPTSVEQRRPVETLDIPENRFVLDVARRMAQTADDVLLQPWITRAPEAELARVETLRNALRTFTRDRQFGEVGPMTRIPVESRVLQRRDGYRELTRLWFAFQRARQPMFDRLQHAIDVRDIATLYEYWVFFELVDQIGAAVGVSGVLDALGNDGMTHGLTCTFGRMGKLVYNPKERGYSGVSLRPDYLWTPTDGQPVVFDAKFRMTQHSMAANDSEPDLPPGVAYDPKDDDLVKMHAYRDALRVRAAMVLYPGTSAVFRATTRETRSVTVATVVQNEGLSGVGEIGMSPLATGAGQ